MTTEEVRERNLRRVALGQARDRAARPHYLRYADVVKEARESAEAAYAVAIAPVDAAYHAALAELSLESA